MCSWLRGADDQAAVVLHAFASSHIQVPQDIRLVGYDIDMAAELVTPFSTYVNRSDSSARPAVRLVIDQIAQDPLARHPGSTPIRIGHSGHDLKQTCAPRGG